MSKNYSLNDHVRSFVILTFREHFRPNYPFISIVVVVPNQSSTKTKFGVINRWVIIDIYINYMS